MFFLYETQAHDINRTMTRQVERPTSHQDTVQGLTLSIFQYFIHRLLYNNVVQSSWDMA